MREVIELLLLAVIVYAAFQFAVGRVRVVGGSMRPALQPGQYVLVDKVSTRFGAGQRGDIVVFTPNVGQAGDLIKRVVTLPGETITLEAGQFLVNGAAVIEPYVEWPQAVSGPWTLGSDEYFVVGDNRPASAEPRTWGRCRAAT